jgi:hypothetical protein
MVIVEVIHFFVQTPKFNELLFIQIKILIYARPKHGLANSFILYMSHRLLENFWNN